MVGKLIKTRWHEQQSHLLTQPRFAWHLNTAKNPSHGHLCPNQSHPLFAAWKLLTDRSVGSFSTFSLSDSVYHYILWKFFTRDGYLLEHLQKRLTGFAQNPK